MRRSKNFKRILRLARSKMRLVPFFIKLLQKSVCLFCAERSVLPLRQEKWLGLQRPPRLQGKGNLSAKICQTAPTVSPATTPYSSRQKVYRGTFKGMGRITRCGCSQERRCMCLRSVRQATPGMSENVAGRGSVGGAGAFCGKSNR